MFSHPIRSALPLRFWSYCQKLVIVTFALFAFSPAFAASDEHKSYDSVDYQSEINEAKIAVMEATTRAQLAVATMETLQLYYQQSEILFNRNALARTEFLDIQLNYFQAKYSAQELAARVEESKLNQKIVEAREVVSNGKPEEINSFTDIYVQRWHIRQTVAEAQQSGAQAKYDREWINYNSMKNLADLGSENYTNLLDAKLKLTKAQGDLDVAKARTEQIKAIVAGKLDKAPN